MVFEEGTNLPIQDVRCPEPQRAQDVQTILADWMAPRPEGVRGCGRVLSEECRHVVDLLGKVYHHDEIGRERKLVPDSRVFSSFHPCQGVHKHGDQYSQGLEIDQLGRIAIEQQGRPGRKFVIFIVENKLK